MANENELDLDSQNQADDIVIGDNDDADAIREKFGKLAETHKKVADYNKQLFARAKKAEGFEQNDKGDWVKFEKKPKVEPKPEPKSEAKPDDKLFARLEKLALGQAGITHVDDIELARSTAKKWNMEIEEVLADEDFKAKLERQKTNRANTEATTNIKGSSMAPSKAKESPDYWIAKGAPPTPDDIPDRKVRTKIVRAMMDRAKTSGKTFYNE